MIGRLPSHVLEPDIGIYESSNYVVLDFETTTADKGSPLNPSNRIILAVWRRPDGEVVSRRASEYELGELVEDVESADFIVAHNAKFELGWLKRCGVDLTKVLVYDTMLADYVLGGNQMLLNHLSLSKCLARRRLNPKVDLVGRMIKGGIPVENIPARWLDTYCRRDVSAAHELFNLTRCEVQDAGLMQVLYQRCLVSCCLADIEFNGMVLDCERTTELCNRREEEYYEAERNLESFCGGINAGSPKQLAEFVYETLGFSVPKDHIGREILTPKGERSVNNTVMEKLAPRTKRQAEFIELRKTYATLRAEVTKYLTKFKECCDEAGGLLRAVFNQGTTRTHRLSSSGQNYAVQFQNFPRVFKRLFKARESGWYVGEADGAQLEFRIATHLGRDKVGLADIRGGRDVHSFTADVLTGAGQPTDRQGAKAHTFKPLYGGSSGTDAEQTYYEAFKQRYKGIADTQLEWCRSVLRDKHLTTEWGLRYHWPDTKVTQSGYITNTTSICNYPVQALATAEIIPVALVCAWHRIRSAGLRTLLVNTVHDSIIAEVPPEEVDTFHELAQQCLIRDAYYVMERLYGVRLTVPLGAGVKVGEHWGEGEEVKYEAPEELYVEAAQAEGMA